MISTRLLSTCLSLAIGLFSCESENKNKQDIDAIFATKKATAAELKFLSSNIDFGDVSNDTTLTAKFQFYNEGKDTLFINSVQADCKCTSATVSKKSISPQDSATIILKIETKGKLGQQTLLTTVSANTYTKLYLLRTSLNVK